MSETMQYLSFSVCLISLNLLTFISIHVDTNDRISLCSIWSTFCISIFPLMDILVDSTSWSLGTVL
jgi:hypothetical protein